MALIPYENLWQCRRRHLRGALQSFVFASDLRNQTSDFDNPGHDWISRKYRDDRMVEVERKFDEMVRRVDARFSGIFSLLDDDELFQTKKVDVEHDGKRIAQLGGDLNNDSLFIIARSHITTPIPDSCADAEETNRFSLKIDVQDFKPEEVKVKVENGQVFVHAKRENKKEVDGMYAYSYREFRKAFAVPKDIDIEKVTSDLTSSGILQIDAPKKRSAGVAIEGSVSVAVEHTKNKRY